MKVVAEVSINKKIMPLVRMGSMNSLNLSNFGFYNLKLIEFEMHGIRFNIFEPVNFA